MAAFDEYELSWYFLDGTCVSCGNLVTVPCPVDAPGYHQ
jgi:predicted molibdopterin-dependent oxidoreductase YjgC